MNLLDWIVMHPWASLLIGLFIIDILKILVSPFTCSCDNDDDKEERNED